MMTREERMLADGLAEEPLEFYRPQNAYGFMSNFSHHEVKLLHPFSGHLAVYPTGEHRFQAMKATTAKDHDRITNLSSPGEAQKVGRQIKLREGWGNDYGHLCWYVMLELVMAKTMQHLEINQQLSQTGSQVIWEDSPYDNIWGIRKGNDYNGKNLLGRVWLTVRLNLELVKENQHLLLDTV